MDKAGGAGPSGMPQVPSKPAPCQVSYPNRNFQQQELRPALIFSQQVLDPKKTVNMEQTCQRTVMVEQNLK